MHAQPNQALLGIWRDRLRTVGFSGTNSDLASAARHEAADVRAIAVALAGLEPVTDETRSLITAALADPVPPVRVEAARAAAAIGDDRGVEALRQLLAIDWPDVALNAAAYLADAGQPDGWPVMAAAARHSLVGLRLQAVLLARAFLPFEGRAVGADRVDVAGLLRLGVSDAEALVRREAVYQAAHLDDDARREILGRALADSDPAVVRAAQLRLAGPVT